MAMYNRRLVEYTADEEIHSFGNGGVENVNRIWLNGRQLMTLQNFAMGTPAPPTAESNWHNIFRRLYSATE